jgi:hypothetical protein
MNPFIISFLKLLTGLLGLIVAAGMKWSKEQFKLRSIREAIVQHRAWYPHQDRLLYKDGVERFMKKNHPQNIDFAKELWANAFRPVYILTLVLLTFYHDVPLYVIFSIAISLCTIFAEINFDGWKEQKWFKAFLVIIWILTYFILAYSECEVKSNKSENQTIQQQQKDSTGVSKDPSK